METKTCSKCKIEKPLTEFHKDKNKKDGHRSECKFCHNSRKKAYREANREKLKARLKAYYEANREKIKARKKAYREANPEKRKAYREANIEKEKARLKAYREANREKIKARKKAYNQTPRGRFFSYRSSAKQRGIEFLLTEEQTVEMIKKPCTYCGRPKSSGIDRIDSNGAYTLENCEPCCGTCNTRKGTKSKEVFLQEIKEGKWN